MSVLLDALKKAAENKNQTDESVEAKTDQTEQVVAAEKQQDEIPAEPEQAEGGKGLGLKLINEESGAEGQVPPSIDDLDSGVGHAQEPETTKPEIADTTQSEPQQTELDQFEQEGAEPPVLQEPEAVQVEETEEVEQPVETMEAEPAKATSELQLEASPESPEPERSVAIEPEEAVPSVGSEAKSDAADSYEWSMSSLPGYQDTTGEPTATATSTGSGVPEEGLNEANPVLSDGKRFPSSSALSLRNMFSAQSSTKALYVLVFLLLISSLVFFSMLYYQDQNAKLENSMKQYEIVQLKPVEPGEKAGESQSIAAKSDSQTAAELNAAAQKTEPATKTAQTSTHADEQSQSMPKSERKVVAEPEPPVVDVEPAPKPKKVVTYSKREAAKPVKYEAMVTAASPASGERILSIQAVEGRSEINEAYEALYNGQYDQARKHFERILSRDENQIEALNGMGALSSLLGQSENAQDYYYRVLDLDPDNLHAFEAVISINGSAIQGEEWKQELKRVLEIHPKSAVLNQALGNIYAMERDWEKAQSFFFEAYARDKQNADYLVNLAISLDRLGQYALASKYYSLALVHADKGPINFDVASIKHRLASIKQFIEKTDL